MLGTYKVSGIPLRYGAPTRGNVYFVHSGSGVDDIGSYGSKPDRPFATMNYASSKCSANQGDEVIVLPNHTETVTAAAGLSLAVAGVKLVGIGHGSNRPTINFTTSTGADMDIDAANISMSNFLFSGGIDALVAPIDINAADFSMINCETRDVTGQAVDFIVSDANADRLVIDGWIHRGASAAGAQSAISMIGGDDIIIRNFNVYGNFSASAIENVTTAMNRVSIGGGSGWNYGWTENAADKIVSLLAATTGWIGPNICAMLQDNAANITEAFVGAGCQFIQPIEIVNLAGESSMQTNITASTDA